jgi:Right handed beta helix region
VPEGSTINICPGTYYEQVTISQSLTLRGVSYGNSSKAVIVLPPGGLATTPSLHYGTVAPQVEITAGTVDITGITVDGTASSSNCPSVNYVGIFYSGSSGTVNEVETRYQNCGDNVIGVGILAEDGASSRSVTIENSNIHDYSLDGIVGYGADYTVSIENNFVFSSPSPGNTGIAQFAHAGDVSGNTVTGALNGIVVEADVVVSGNTVSDTVDGIDVYVKATVTSNRISDGSRQGIGVFADGASIKNNIIMELRGASVGLEVGCSTNVTVSGNTVNGAYAGIDGVPASINGANTFNNVSAVKTSPRTC